MSRFEDFSVAERVAHITNGDGVVVGIVDGCVIVEFDRKSAKGKNWRGAYDANWFQLHPEFLFHRSMGT